MKAKAMKKAPVRISRGSVVSMAALFLGTQCAPAAQSPASLETSGEAKTEAPKESKKPAEAPRVSLVPEQVGGSLLPPLSKAITSFGAAKVGEHIYTMGGYHGTPHSYSLEGQSRKIHRLNLSDPKKWEEFSELKEALQGLAAFSHDGKLCQVGGNHAYNKKGEDADMRSVATVRCLKTADGKWVELPALPAPRSSHELALVGQTLYVAGGWDLRGTPDKAVWAEDFLTLDLGAKEPQWRSTPVPFRVRAAGVAATETHLIVVGGISPEGEPTKNVRFYDLAEKTWSEGPEYPDFAFGIALRAVDGVVYASGRDGMLRSITPGAKEWNEVRPLAFARFFHQMVPVDAGFVVLGGISGMHTRGRTRPVEIVPRDASVTSWGQYVLPHQGKAKNRQGILRHDEELYFFGGNNSLGQHDFAQENFLDSGFFFDLATLSYQKAPSFPLRRQSMVTLSTEKGGLAAGGFGYEAIGKSPSTDEERAQATSQKEVFAFDWAKRSWSHVSDLPRGRTQFGLERFGDKDWIFGGLNYDSRREGAGAFDHVQDILAAQSGKKGGQFQPLEVTLPGPRRAFAGAILNGKAYFVGGMKAGFSLVDDCLSFDFNTQKFGEFVCPGGPRLSGSLIAARGRLYLIGGMAKTDKGLQESRSIQVYDPEGGSWSKLDFELPLSTRHLRALPYRDQILLISTQGEKGELTMALLSPGRK